MGRTSLRCRSTCAAVDDRPPKNLVIRPQRWFATCRWSSAFWGRSRSERDGEELPLGGPKQRALLAILLLHANEAVSRDRLIDGLWGERPPPSAAHTLDNYVSRLRKALGDGRLITRARPATCSGSSPTSSTSIASSGCFRAGREHARRGDASGAARAAGPRWRCGADRLWPTCCTSRSRQPRAAGSRSGGSTRSKTGSRPISRSAPAQSSFRSSRRWCASSRFANARSASSCLLSTERGGRRRRSPPSRPAGSDSPTSWGSSPGPQLVELQRKILEHDPSLRRGQRPRDPQPRPRRAPPSPAGDRRRGRGHCSRSGVAIGIVLGDRRRRAEVASLGAATARIVALSSRSGSGRRRSCRSTGSAAAVAVAATARSGSPIRAPASSRRVDLAFAGDRRPRSRRRQPGVARRRRRVGLGGERARRQRHAGRPADGDGDADDAARARASRRSPSAPDGALGRRRHRQLADRDRPGVGSGATDARAAASTRPRSRSATGRSGSPTTTRTSVAEVDLRIRTDGRDRPVGNGPRRSRSDRRRSGSRTRSTRPSPGSTRQTAQSSRRSRSAAVRRRSRSPAARLGREPQYSATVSRIDPRTQQRRRHASRGRRPGRARRRRRPCVGRHASRSLQHRGGTLRLSPATRSRIDPALQFDLLPLQSDGLTRDGLVTYNHVAGPGRDAARPRPRGQPAGADRRRDRLHVPAAAGHPLLRRPAGPRLGTSGARSSGCSASAREGATCSPRRRGGAVLQRPRRCDLSQRDRH